MHSGINKCGNPFDFQKWCSWLEDRSKDLHAEGYITRFGSMEEIANTKTNLEVASGKVIAYFTKWGSGETDFLVLETKSGQPLVDRMGVIVDDSSFESTFEDFRKHLRFYLRPTTRDSYLFNHSCRP